MTSTRPAPPKDLYRFAAPIYDLATALWSGGAIWRSRCACLEGLQPGDRVLIPGPGTGRLAVEAARRGAAVTAVEHSGVMAKRFEARARRVLGAERFRSTEAAIEGPARYPAEHPVAHPVAHPAAHSAESPGQSKRSAAGTLLLIRGRVEELPPSPGVDSAFDLVVLEHFLNVFQPKAMDAMRCHLIQRVAPGGRLAIADFTPIRPGAAGPLRSLQRLHHVVPLGGCSLLTRNAMHPIYDHGADLANRKDLRLLHQQDFRSFAVGPGWFRAWIFEKMASDE